MPDGPIELVDAAIGEPDAVTTCQPYIRPLQEQLRYWRLAAEIEVFAVAAVIIGAALMRLRKRG